MASHRYGDFRVEVFYFDSPCIEKYNNLPSNNTAVLCYGN